MAEERIVIIGGGLAGLTAGLHLAERGLKPLLLEADTTVLGGRVAGGEMVTVGDWPFRGEHGVHGIWAGYNNLRAMLERHGILPELVPAVEQDWIYKRGSRVKRAAVGMAIRYSPLPAPLHYLNLFALPRFLGMLDIRDWLSLPRVWAGLVWALGVDPLAEDQPLRGMTLDDLVRHWSPAVRAFMIGLTRNGLSARAEEIPLSGYIAFLRFYSVLRRDSWGFSYFPADAGTSLIDPLAARARQLGVRVRMGARAMRIERMGEGWRVRLADGDAVDAEDVVLAVDANAAKRLLADSPDMAEDVRDHYWPSWRETAVMRIWYDRSVDTGSEAGIFTGDVTIDNFFWLHRIQDQYRDWHQATGGSAIEVHVYGPPERLAQPDAQLLANAISDVQAAFPALRGHRIHQTLQRHAATHTLFAADARERQLNVVTLWAGVYACGDWVWDAAPPLFLERATLTGMLAANAVLQRRGLPIYEPASYPEPERLAGWIQSWIRRGRQRRRRQRGTD